MAWRGAGGPARTDRSLLEDKTDKKIWWFLPPDPDYNHLAKREVLERVIRDGEWGSVVRDLYDKRVIVKEDDEDTEPYEVVGYIQNWERSREIVARTHSDQARLVEKLDVYRKRAEPKPPKIDAAFYRDKFQKSSERTKSCRDTLVESLDSTRILLDSYLSRYDLDARHREQLRAENAARHKEAQRICRSLVEDLVCTAMAHTSLVRLRPRTAGGRIGFADPGLFDPNPTLCPPQGSFMEQSQTTTGTRGVLRERPRTSDGIRQIRPQTSDGTRVCRSPSLRTMPLPRPCSRGSITRSPRRSSPPRRSPPRAGSRPTTAAQTRGDVEDLIVASVINVNPRRPWTASNYTKSAMMRHQAGTWRARPSSASEMSQLTPLRPKTPEAYGAFGGGGRLWPVRSTRGYP